MTRVDIRGVHVNVERRGPVTGRTLLALHGFTGSVATWHPFLAEFSRHVSILAVDALGHGGSDAPSDPTRYAVAEAVLDLAAVLERFSIDAVVLLGYSMGGRVALEFALTFPERTRSLILESASPGIVHPRERRVRQSTDAKLAEIAEQRGIAAFVDRWELAPIFASQRAMPDDRRAALRAGRLAQNPCGLANSLRGAGQGVAPEAWSRLGDLAMPVKLIVGALDEKYVAIGQKMTTVISRNDLTIVPDAGHSVHLETPEVFSHTVMSFLEVPRAASMG
ncbi:MAG: 2-succinyl-6-hydroxy-2,4-cyclohexadiene-1-carboxylate synthase [Chloroflexota bacterium]|nr:MAG: 2-succinyl-6-hydroxy-2,4-cyclohexadiene-1-carboxylate synthase [Chloroflexota bacterium]